MNRKILAKLLAIGYFIAAVISLYLKNWIGVAGFSVALANMGTILFQMTVLEDQNEVIGMQKEMIIIYQKREEVEDNG